MPKSPRGALGPQPGHDAEQAFEVEWLWNDEDTGISAGGIRRRHDDGYSGEIRIIANCLMQAVAADADGPGARSIVLERPGCTRLREVLAPTGQAHAIPYADQVEDDFWSFYEILAP